MSRKLLIDVKSIDGYTATITFWLGAHKTEDRIQIRCPNEQKDGPIHEICKNGHDTSVKGNPQMFHCKECGKTFYAHTSKIFEDLKNEIKELIRSLMQGGRMDIKMLAGRLHVKKSVSGRILKKILLEIIPVMKRFDSFFKKKRRSNALFVDETFITIGGKTWYLILVTSGNNKGMAVKLVEKRSKQVILKIVKDCAARLLYKLKVLITDGFMVYKGVARGMGHDIIHVRHIHKPPYGRIEIDTYVYNELDVHIHTAKSTNEITAVNGYFIMLVKQKKESLGKRKRGRKPGGKNRPKKVIEAEKKAKAENKKKRGRPKGSKNKPDWEIHVFNHRRKEGCIDAVGGSSRVVQATMSTLLMQFCDKHITTNLVEKEFSVLKKLIDFRGHRNEELWSNLIEAYFAIRDEPKILKEALENLEISPQMVQKVLPALIRCEVVCA